MGGSGEAVFCRFLGKIACWTWYLGGEVVVFGVVKVVRRPRFFLSLSIGMVVRCSRRCTAAKKGGAANQNVPQGLGSAQMQAKRFWAAAGESPRSPCRAKAKQNRLAIRRHYVKPLWQLSILLAQLEAVPLSKAQQTDPLLSAGVR